MIECVAFYKAVDLHAESVLDVDQMCRTTARLRDGRATGWNADRASSNSLGGTLIDPYAVGGANG